MTDIPGRDGGILRIGDHARFRSRMESQMPHHEPMHGVWGAGANRVRRMTARSFRRDARETNIAIDTPAAAKRASPSNSVRACSSKDAQLQIST